MNFLTVDRSSKNRANIWNGVKIVVILHPKIPVHVYSLNTETVKIL